jgi:hypothetical protein
MLWCGVCLIGDGGGELTADGGGFFFLGVGGHVDLFVGLV